jgi:hypothetical protein
MLNYSTSFQSFSELLAADLDDEAWQFYARTVSDLTVLGTAVDRSREAAGVATTLLPALAAAPAAQAAVWRRVYREIALFVRICDPMTVHEDLQAAFVRALGHLRQFLSENADLSEASALDRRGHIFGHAAQA